jgi:benzodiazapine receptor
MFESRRDLVALLVFVGICLAVEVIAGRATSVSIRGWYLELQKPGWTPPGWLFPPLWTLLYLSMGVAGWLVWQTRDEQSIGLALGLFGLQLFLNLIWSVIFFGLRQTGWGLVDILLLWASIVATIGVFLKIRPAAGLLLLPYLAWVSYATALNYTIWKLNR